MPPQARRNRRGPGVGVESEPGPSLVLRPRITKTLKAAAASAASNSPSDSGPSEAGLRTQVSGSASRLDPAELPVQGRRGDDRTAGKSNAPKVPGSRDQPPLARPLSPVTQLSSATPVIVPDSVKRTETQSVPHTARSKAGRQHRTRSRKHARARFG